MPFLILRRALMFVYFISFYIGIFEYNRSAYIYILHFRMIFLLNKEKLYIILYNIIYFLYFIYISVRIIFNKKYIHIYIIITIINFY